MAPGFPVVPAASESQLEGCPDMGTFVLAASSSTKSSGGSFEFILFAVAIFALVYVFMIRPQQRRRQQAAQKTNTVAPGAQVRTTAGMYATVVEVDGDDVVLEVAPGVEVRYMKRAIMDVVSPGGVPEEEPSEAEPADDDEPADEADHDVEAANDTPEAGDDADAAY